MSAQGFREGAAAAATMVVTVKVEPEDNNDVVLQSIESDDASLSNVDTKMFDHDQDCDGEADATAATMAVTEPEDNNDVVLQSIEFDESSSNVDTENFDHDQNSDSEADTADKSPSPPSSHIDSGSSKVSPGPRDKHEAVPSPPSPSSRVPPIIDPVTGNLDRPVVVSARGSKIIKIWLPKRLRSNPDDQAPADLDRPVVLSPRGSKIIKIWVPERLRSSRKDPATTSDGTTSAAAGKGTKTAGDGGPASKRRKRAA